MVALVAVMGRHSRAGRCLGRPVRPGVAAETTAQAAEGTVVDETEDGDRIVYRFARSDPTQAGTITGIVQGVVSQLNQQATGEAPRFQVETISWPW